MTRKELNIKGLSEEVLDLLSGVDITPYEKVNIELESHLDYIDDDYEEEIYDEDELDEDDDIEFDTIPGGEEMPYPYKYDYMVNHADHINIPALRGLDCLNKDIMPLQGKLVNTSKEELAEAISNKLSEAKYGLDFDGDTTPPMPMFSTASLINRFGEDGYKNLILKKVTEKLKEYGKLSKKDSPNEDALKKLREGIFTHLGCNPIASKLTIDELRREASENRFNLHLVDRDPRSGIIYGTLLSNKKEKMLNNIEEEYQKLIKDINDEDIKKINESKEFIETLIKGELTSDSRAEMLAKEFIQEMKDATVKVQKEEPNDRYLSEDTISDLKDLFNRFKTITNDKNLINEAEDLLNKTIETVKTQGIDDNISLQFCNKMNHILIQSYINDICSLKKAIEKEFGKSPRVDGMATCGIRGLNKYDREEEVLACAITKPIYVSNLRDSVMNSLNIYTNNKIKEKYALSK